MELLDLKIVFSDLIMFLKRNKTFDNIVKRFQKKNPVH